LDHMTPVRKAELPRRLQHADVRLRVGCGIKPGAGLEDELPMLAAAALHDHEALGERLQHAVELERRLAFDRRDLQLQLLDEAAA
jgi:hypothetical protein